ncbi:hypothetical protein CH305_19880 [Rhodococcus sp. 15-649-2-2]|uniref:hypothetical protein n=1 Tax=Rhodococcus sp. 15-649-2-2 TaxID=2023140 RepID=UPI000B9AF3F4|nr:hypothetical protein [Rhodococcus sp. 15-649-2-2]OZE76068.1 hypothetical protein CH305_19880 [Rhodococcus sp. 15-649-2-2]
MAKSTEGGWFRRLFSRSTAERLDPTREDLVIVASCFDDAQACSAVLEDAARTPPVWTAASDVLLRHHLLLPAHEVEDAAAVAAQDDYEVGPAAELSDIDGYRPHVDDGVPLVLQRVQVLDALHCSQERSRMAGLAQRRGGAVLGWDALQPAQADPASG